MSTQTSEEVRAIELIVEQDESGQVAAVVPIRWKISEEMVQQLSEVKEQLYMLLVVAVGTTELDRVLVPLKAGMTYLQMSRPGTISVHGTIVWREEDEQSPKKTLTSRRSDGEYSTLLLHSFLPGEPSLLKRLSEIDAQIWHAWEDDEKRLRKEAKTASRLLAELRTSGLEEQPGFYEDITGVEQTPESDRLDVVVPEGMFAKEPPRWMKWLGKWFPSDRAPRDQCDLRRRAIVVVVASPIAVAGAVVFGVLAAVLWLGFKLVAVIITAVLLFFGRRELDFSVIYQWNNLAMPDIWQFSRPSIWTSKKVSSVGYVNRPFWQQLLTPPMVAGFVVISMVARQSVTDGIFIGVSLVLALSLIAFLGARVVTKLKQAPKRTISVEQRSKQQRELALLTAGGSASLDDLPPEQRTVRLRFLDLKASVCKPFAK